MSTTTVRSDIEKGAEAAFTTYLGDRDIKVTATVENALTNAVTRWLNQHQTQVLGAIHVTDAERDELDRLHDLVAPDGTVVTSPTAPEVVTAEHIAHHFALDTITYDLRNDEMSDREDDFEPAVTGAEILEALISLDELAETLPAGTPLEIPAYPVVINEAGEEVFTDADKLTDPHKQLNAILVQLAESIALRKEADAAKLRAIGLCLHFKFDINQI